MTRRPLTDDQLAVGLRAHLAGARDGLHEQILAEISTTPQEHRLPSILGRLTDADPMARRRTMLLGAVVALALSISVTATAGALLRESQTPDLSIVPPADIDHSDAVVHGWPSSGGNKAGVYSLDGSRCSKLFCVVGFMHNGNGSGDVEIRVDVVPPGSIATDGAASVTVAGRDGHYRRIGALVEEWSAEVEGSTITIRLEARPGASPADLAEAHAIIGSMRAEPRDNPDGFRLVFRLTTDDWDSG
jgi:hypothetical protein